MGEVAAVAHVLTHVGLWNAIEDHVQFARARFGEYDTIDFVVVLLGYAISGEATLQSFYERLIPNRLRCGKIKKNSRQKGMKITDGSSHHTSSLTLVG
jgi:hypothetical protein